uniref:BACK domain-containing protein n=1 Tax=Panagrellus redivivus TaxID=6233 RepID=A0A7E4VU20_PANRE
MMSVSEVDVFHAVIRWMKANPTKSADFQNVLKNVPLTQITLKSLDSIPPEVLEHTNVLAERARQLRTQKRLPYYQKENENVSYGLLFAPKHQLLMHKIGSSEEGILIDLGRIYLLNYLKMNIVSDGTNYSYWIDVSEDNVNWTRVIDRLKYPCHGFQYLCFNSHYARFIRIFGEAPDRDMVITEFYACYATMYFDIDPETTLMERHFSFATDEGNKILVDGHMKPENAYIDGTYFEYDRSNYRIFGQRHFLLKYTRFVSSMELLCCEWDDDKRVHSYDIEVSVDQINWTRIFCVKRDASYRGIHFNRRPVKKIKLIAYTEANEGVN